MTIRASDHLPWSWIQTWSGKALDLVDPQPDQVCLADIAHALAYLNRYTGHTRRPYTVAEHSVEVANRLPPELAWEGLMHDAAEYGVGDGSSPLKRAMRRNTALAQDGIYDSTNPPLSVYDEIAGQLDKVIRAKYGLPPVETPAVKTADLSMLYVERDQLLLPPPQGWGLPKVPVTHTVLRCDGHHRAKSRWLQEAARVAPEAWMRVQAREAWGTWMDRPEGW